MTARFLAPLLLLVGLALWISGPFSRIPPSPILRPRSFHLPVYFIKNQGQAPPEVAYYVQGRHAGAWFTPSAVYYTLRKPGPFRPASTSPDTVSTVQLFFERANPDARLETGAPAAAQVSYFRGPREQWRTGLPTYSSVVYRDLWPGIDLEFAGPDGNLKYTFHVRPGADPRQIQLAYRGAYAVSLTPRGSLHIATPAGDFVDDQPLAWQQTSAGRKPVTAGFRLDGEQVRFQLGAYDPTLPLTIDPAVLLYSGYLGGGADDLVQAIAVDTAGNAYVVGNTQSTQSSFPVSGGPDLTHNSGGDGFVAKVNPTGTALLYVGYIGGNGDDLARSIAVDPAGNAYISGYTNSTQATFPVLVGPDLTHNGAQDAFVAKLNPAGTALVYCGYVGGANDDFAFGLAVDASGSAHFIGSTFSNQSTFPVLVGPDLTHNGGDDAFVAKVSPSGSSLLYLGYVGGAGNDYGRGIALDAAGNAYVTGETGSTQASFPVTVGPDLTHNGDIDGFVAKIDATGSAFLFCGYVGGTAADSSYGIAVDAANNVYLAGLTNSTQTSFPALVGPDLTHNGDFDAFVVKVNAAGDSLAFSGYIGGAGRDFGYSIGVDPAGNSYLTGYTESSHTSFPTIHGPDSTFNGAGDAFVAKVNASGAALVYSGFHGGLGFESGNGIAVDRVGAVFFGGYTSSFAATFPVVAGPDSTFNGGSADSFVAKLDSFRSTAGPNFVFRNGFNAIETGTFPSSQLRNSGGNFRSNPSIALSPEGRAFLAGRDGANGIWVNFVRPDDTYNSWTFAQGNAAGSPSVGVTGETAWIAIRDPWNSYWVRSYSSGGAFGSWTWLQGIFATDPHIAGCPNGDLYVTGKDTFNGIWTRRYNAASSAWDSWRFIGGIVNGAPTIACGADSAAYIAVRDPSNNMWLARVFQADAAEWTYGQGLLEDDLQMATNGNMVHVGGLSAGVPWYRTWQVGAGWQDWTNTQGVLTHFALATYGGQVHVAGVSAQGDLWWWTSLGPRWTNYGSRNIAAGSRLSAAAR